MPASRSTRGKRHCVKPIGFRLPPSPKTVESIKAMLERLETSVLFRLREGKCVLEDFCDIRDVLNIVAYIMTRRQKAFRDRSAELRSSLDEITEAGRANKRLSDRVKEGKSAVAHGWEYELILDVLEDCTEFCIAELNEAPGMFIDDFNASKVITAGRISAEVSVSKKIIDWAYGVAVQVSRMSYRQQEIFWNEVDQRGIPWGINVNFEQMMRRRI